ncbi:MAG: hypothetical protein ACREJS_01455 [Candidatus Rokuibacteriota bacterium]
MQAYLNQEFPLGPTDLRLHPVDFVEDSAGVEDDRGEPGARPACGMGYWRVALATGRSRTP